MLYFHITEREERRNAPVHVETEEQKERRLERERADRSDVGMLGVCHVSPTHHVSPQFTAVLSGLFITLLHCLC